MCQFKISRNGELIFNSKGISNGKIWERCTHYQSAKVLKLKMNLIDLSSETWFIELKKFRHILKSVDRLYEVSLNLNFPCDYSLEMEAIKEEILDLINIDIMQRHERTIEELRITDFYVFYNAKLEDPDNQKLDSIVCSMFKNLRNLKKLYMSNMLSNPCIEYPRVIAKILLFLSMNEMTQFEHFSIELEQPLGGRVHIWQFIGKANLEYREGLQYYLRSIADSLRKIHSLRSLGVTLKGLELDLSFIKSFSKAVLSLPGLKAVSLDIQMNQSRISDCQQMLRCLHEESSLSLEYLSIVQKKNFRLREWLNVQEVITSFKKLRSLHLHNFHLEHKAIPKLFDMFLDLSLLEHLTLDMRQFELLKEEDSYMHFFKTLSALHNLVSLVLIFPMNNESSSRSFGKSDVQALIAVFDKLSNTLQQLDLSFDSAFPDIIEFADSFTKLKKLHFLRIQFKEKLLSAFFSIGTKQPRCILRQTDLPNISLSPSNKTNVSTISSPSSHLSDLINSQKDDGQKQLEQVDDKKLSLYSSETKSASINEHLPEFLGTENIFQNRHVNIFVDYESFQSFLNNGAFTIGLNLMLIQITIANACESIDHLTLNESCNFYDDSEGVVIICEERLEQLLKTNTLKQLEIVKFDHLQNICMLVERNILSLQRLRIENQFYDQEEQLQLYNEIFKCKQLTHLCLIEFTQTEFPFAQFLINLPLLSQFCFDVHFYDFQYSDFQALLNTNYLSEVLDIKIRNRFIDPNKCLIPARMALLLQSIIFQSYVMPYISFNPFHCFWDLYF